MSTLLLRLAAPLQSWGDDSKFNNRRTYSIPTKSGILGMLAAALGRKRDDTIDDLKKLEIGVRVDQEGIELDDFQMVHGKKQSDMTRRYYLSDAIFLVGLFHFDDAFLSKLEEALFHPVYPLFLGRRSCPPSYPLVLGIRDSSLQEALEKEPWLAQEWRQKRLSGKLRLVLESERDTTAVLHRLRDVPVSFSPERREYQYRYIKEGGYVEFSGEQETEHDAFGELG